MVVKDAEAFARGNAIIQLLAMFEAVGEGREEASGGTKCDDESDEVLVEDLAFSVSGERWDQRLKHKNRAGG
jgi:hypothetical protein